MPKELIGSRDKVLKVLYSWRTESISESVGVADLSAKTGLDSADMQAVIEDLLGQGYIKVATGTSPTLAYSYIKITKAGRDYLREKSLAG